MNHAIRITALHGSAKTSPSMFRRLAGWPARVVSRWRAATTLAALERLDPHLLRDIGLDGDMLLELRDDPCRLDRMRLAARLEAEADRWRIDLLFGRIRR